jgi:sarcosine oxidase
MTVVVVGAGIHGLAAARALARRGRRVVVLERFRFGHTRGSSHGVSRVFRLSYPEEEYVRLAQDARGGWRELEHEAGEELFRTTGTLDVGDYAAENEATLTACEVAAEWLDQDEVARRFDVTVTRAALFQPDGGLLLADRCLAAFASGARAAGAELREEVVATSLTQNESGVQLETSGGALDAEAVVVAAGAWAPRLLATAEIELDAVPSRETVAYARTPNDRAGMPAVIEETEPGRIVYALQAPGTGIKAGIHASGPLTDPNQTAGPSQEIADEIEAWLDGVFKDHDRVRLETCLYTNRPEERFALERHGAIVVGSACSGHGFKFAPVVGERLASLAEEVLT